MLAVAIVNKELDYSCRACTSELQERRGCRKETEDEAHWIYLEEYEEPIKRCPLKLVKPWHYRVVQLHGLLESGILPTKGGWLDQSAAFAQAAAIVGHAKEESRKKDGKPNTRSRR